VGDFLSRHYRFDEVRIGAIRVERAGSTIEVGAGPIDMRLTLGPSRAPSRLLSLRPRALRVQPAWIAFEDAVARPLVGPWFAAGAVRTRGRTAGGAREWYAIHDFRAGTATASIDGLALGPTMPTEPAGFGFSEFPNESALVRVTSIFDGTAM